MVKLKKIHKMAFDQNLTNEEIWENPLLLKMIPNHSILFDIEPKTDEHIFVEYLQGASVMMNIQKEK